MPSAARAVTGLALAALLLGVGAFLVTPRTPWAPPDLSVPPLVDVDGLAVAEQVAALIRIDTQNPPGASSWASAAPPAVDGEEAPEAAAAARPAWVDHLVRTYAEPLELTWRMLEGGLVIELPSTDARPPVLLLSHVDVVPVEDRDRPRWTHPPFDGVVADGLLWGRGALDNKASVVAQLEAYAAVKASGGALSRRVVMLVTPDEETGGATAGAVATAHLDALGGPAAVIDEGAYFLPDLVPGVVVGAVAVGEKQYATFELVAHGHAGHSSMPEPGSAIDRLTAALQRVERWETPAGLHPAMVETFRRVAPLQGFPRALVLGHARWFEPVVLGVLQGTAAGNATTRDTVTTTMLSAGIKDNVVPAEARATLNARLLPETDPQTFLAALTAVVDDPQIDVVAQPWNVRAQVSPWDHEVFGVIEAVAAAVAPGAVVAPILTPATMDARHFSAAGLPTYRFHPFLLAKDLRSTLHGVDERIPVDELARGVRFYAALYQTL